MALQGGSNPLDSIFHSVHVVVSYPLESNFRKFAMDFKNCFDGVLKNSDLEQLNAKKKKTKKKKKKKSGQDAVFYGEDGEKGSFRVSAVLGNYTEKCGNNEHDNFSFIRDWAGKLDSLCNNGEIRPKGLWIEHLKRSIFEQLGRFPMFKLGFQAHEFKTTGYEGYTSLDNHFEQTLCRGLWDKENVFGGFLTNLKFAVVEHVSSVKEIGEENAVDEENVGENELQKLAKGILSVPLSDFKPLREGHHEESKSELDRDGDGKVTLEDLEIAMEKRKLPKIYARDFLRHTRTHLFSKSFGWKNFLSLLEKKEPIIRRAYTRLYSGECSKQEKNEILALLENAGYPASEDNDFAMMSYLNKDTKECISYGQFHNFMLLLPSDQLRDGSWSIKSAVEIPRDSVLKSALAGGLSCALSAAIMHPVDTIKTWVQASSTLNFPEVMSKLPQYGVRALYRGSIPAIVGQFSSHGLRTGICEASKLVLINVAPELPLMQVESMSSFCGTFLGTAVRIPCEVLKQRLQAGLFENVGQAIVGTWREDGAGGFFRGTAATLCREIPFYVAGMGLYAESKKVVQRLIGRELQPWETVAVGALSGGLTAVLTTPIDVIKTRMMVASHGQTGKVSFIVMSILRQEGPVGLFKGAVPRFFWVAPLGAMNFSGYELLRKAMEPVNRCVLIVVTRAVREEPLFAELSQPSSRNSVPQPLRIDPSRASLLAGVSQRPYQALQHLRQPRREPPHRRRDHQRLPTTSDQTEPTSVRVSSRRRQARRDLRPSTARRPLFERRPTVFPADEGRAPLTAELQAAMAGLRFSDGKTPNFRRPYSRAAAEFFFVSNGRANLCSMSSRLLIESNTAGLGDCREQTAVG
ncbi:mitochondrial substrate carrier family protein [Striga hermonthica]|uniref:Mitochondrial substrate carrier family protein n=1 Tax=Striga hermonthica TaxID=68872 RepID=A0A9N7RAW3_STRHE|nr:mitochondrial substrate carrier family protein [Striga hermonthica]